MSIISAGNTTNTAIVVTGDTSGNLVFQSNGVNTVTINNTLGIVFPNGTSQNAAAQSFPSGTVMLFVQNAAPTTWTKSTTHNNKALRIVSGNVSTGGNVAFTTAFSNTTTGAYTLAIADIPSHNHYTDIAGGSGTPARFYASTWGGNDSTVPNIQTGYTGGGGSHSHSLGLAVQYVDVIIATKD